MHPPSSALGFLPVAYRLAAVLLIIAILPIGVYDFYNFLRAIVSIVAVLAIIHIRLLKQQSHSDILTLAFVPVAILFNPILPIHETKTFWIFIDVGTAALFWYLAGWASPDKPFLAQFSDRARNGVAYIAIGLFFVGMVLTSSSDPTALLVIAVIYLVAGVRAMVLPEKRSNAKPDA